jgi:hypothetical protein
VISPTQRTEYYGIDNTVLVLNYPMQHYVKEYGTVEVELHGFLISILGESECLASCPDHFIPGEIAACALRPGDCVRFGTDVEVFSGENPPPPPSGIKPLFSFFNSIACSLYITYLLSGHIRGGSLMSCHT